MVQYLRVSANTVGSRYELCQEDSSKEMIVCEIRDGGPSHDDTNIAKKAKYNKGNRHEEHWVFKV